MATPPPLTREEAEQAKSAFGHYGEPDPGGALELVIRHWQKRLGVTPDGDPGPITRARFDRLAAANAPDLLYQPPTSVPAGEPPWFSLGRRYLGLHEVRDNARLAEFLSSDGHYLGDPKALPWCGDFVETCIRRTLSGEAVPANRYLARSWLGFGVPTAPTVGAVAVFYRHDRSGSAGHVGFVAGESADGRSLYVLGGNQSNSVSVAPLSRERLLGCRWPTTFPAPGEASPLHLPTLAGGRLSTNEA